jgi:ferredoxin
MAAVVDPEKCTGCETCVESCPLDAISMKDGKAVVDPDTCGDCGACVDACPVEAIRMD